MDFRRNSRHTLPIVSAAVGLGTVLGLLHDPDRPNAASGAEVRRDTAAAVAAVPVPAPAPVSAPALKAARDVLAGVGIEGSARRARVQTALEVLDAEVAKQSDPSALKLAFQAYYSYKEAHPEQVRKPYLYYVDYGLDATTPRGYVFDMERLEVVDGPFTVAHGRGSAPNSRGIPTRFSNRQGSNATSLGLFLAQETYGFRGKSGGRSYSSVGLRLKGVSGRFNSAARARGVVAHGAPYVTRSKAGRSEGCPAMEPGRARELLPQIANGGLVFLFSPLERNWMSADPWANG
ncbi:MAG TPA: murein L,D-transpeptidase catalytic domain family protein [Longimicrobiaceae bacterium]